MNKPSPFFRIALLTTAFLAAGAVSGLAQDARTLSTSHANRPDRPVILLTGQVVRDDGQPIKELVQVNLICNGRLRDQTMCRQDGTFSIEVGGQRKEDWMDPSIGGSANGALESTVKVAAGVGTSNLDEVPSMGRGRVSLSGCEVRVAPRPGYASSVVRLGTRSSTDSPDIGALILRRLDDSGATTVSLSYLSAPKAARKAFEKAQEELRESEPDTDKIEKELRKALREFPDFSAAWDLLGRVEMSQGARDQARESFLQAVEAEPKFLNPYLALSQMAVEAQDWPDAETWGRKVLELDPQNRQGLYWHGLACFYLQKFADGEKSLARLYKESGNRKSYPFGLLPYGVIQANLGNVQGAAESLESYLKEMPQEQVPEAQRVELESQIAQWRAEGLVSLHEE